MEDKEKPPLSFKEFIEEEDLSYHELESIINEWVLSEKHRAMLKRNLLDDVPYRVIAEEFGYSDRQIARIIPELHKKLFKHIK